MTEVTIQLDARHKAHRSDDRWAISRLQPTGHYDTIETWTGPRRSIYPKLQALNIHPSRTAEAQLAALPERRAFKEDEPK